MLWIFWCQIILPLITVKANEWETSYVVQLNRFLTWKLPQSLKTHLPNQSMRRFTCQAGRSNELKRWFKQTSFAWLVHIFSGSNLELVAWTTQRKWQVHSVWKTNRGFPAFFSLWQKPSKTSGSPCSLARHVAYPKRPTPSATTLKSQLVTTWENDRNGGLVVIMFP